MKAWTTASMIISFVISAYLHLRTQKIERFIRRMQGTILTESEFQLWLANSDEQKRLNNLGMWENTFQGICIYSVLTWLIFFANFTDSTEPNW